MGLFDSIFGKKKAVASAPVCSPAKEASKPLCYEDVHKIQSAEERVPLMMKFAEEGEPQALYEMGELYLFGKDGVELNIPKGKQYLYDAIKKGTYNAAILLAMFCIKQAFQEIKPDKMTPDNQQECLGRFWEHYSEGVEQLAFSISKGNATAIAIITGAMPLEWNEGDWSDTLIRETAQALEAYLPELQAADTGNSNYTLGILSVRGIAMPQDFAAARSYLARSAALGNEAAKKELENPLLADDDEDDE